jgi:L-cysteine desulfidase
MRYTAKDILRLEVAPALGCTEPVAIALAAAAAASLLARRKIDALDIWVDPSIYKNGMAVAIPGTHGLSGLATAAGTAVQAALFSLQGVTVQSTDGIIDQSPEQTMQNLGTLSTQGMIETDRTILKIMLAKKFSDY